MAIEIIDLASERSDFPELCGSLPEGKWMLIAGTLSCKWWLSSKRCLINDQKVKLGLRGSCLRWPQKIEPISYGFPISG